MAHARSVLQDALVLTGFASLLLIVHFMTGNGYGFHRDELQFLDDARHLDFGFVAYPPLTSFCGRIAIALFGISPQVLRLPAALVNMASLVLAGLIARELGGGRLAQILALFAVLPVALAFASVLQYNTFDLFAWSLLVFFLARLLRSGDTRNFIGAGIAVGIGVLSKYSIAFPVLSLVAGMAILPGQRPYFRSRFLYLGVLVALVIAAPNLIWLASHHFMTLQMESFIHARDVRNGRADGYFTDQLKFTLLALPLAIAGLVSLLRSARFRLLAFVWLGPFVLFAVVRGRGYYLLAGYPVLYAAGACAFARACSAQRNAVRIAAASVVFTCVILNSVAMGMNFLPLFKPMSAGWKFQMARNSDLRDEIGWPELVQQVAQVRDALPKQDLPRVAVLADNYGEAGAVALYGPQYGLPVPISSVNSFHARGFGPYEPETVIVLGSTMEDQLKNFETCSVAGGPNIPYGVRNEESVEHPDILVCRHLRLPWAVAWARSQAFG